MTMVVSGTCLEGDGLQVLCLSFLLCTAVMRMLAAQALLTLPFQVVTVGLTQPLG